MAESARSHAELTRRALARKPALRALYRDLYRRFAACAERCPDRELLVELGAGGGGLKSVMPDVLTTDLADGPGVDQVVDARALPFDDESVSGLFLLNVFHHIPDVEAFLAEAERCLKPGGRALIIDQYPGLFARPLYQHLHREAFDMQAPRWGFDSADPTLDANGALAWIVFARDRARFELRYPRLSVERTEPHTPVSYWLSGGLKIWSLLPGPLWRGARALDRGLLRVSESFASFWDVELVRRGAP